MQHLPMYEEWLELIETLDADQLQKAKSQLADARDMVREIAAYDDVPDEVNGTILVNHFFENFDVLTQDEQVAVIAFFDNPVTTFLYKTRMNKSTPFEYSDLIIDFYLSLGLPPDIDLFYADINSSIEAINRKLS